MQQDLSALGWVAGSTTIPSNSPGARKGTLLVAHTVRTSNSSQREEELDLCLARAWPSLDSAMVSPYRQLYVYLNEKISDIKRTPSNYMSGGSRGRRGTSAFGRAKANLENLRFHLNMGFVHWGLASRFSGSRETGERSQGEAPLALIQFCHANAKAEMETVNTILQRDFNLESKPKLRELQREIGVLLACTDANNPSLLRSARGRSVDLEQHMRFFRAWLKVAKEQIDAQPWDQCSGSNAPSLKPLRKSIREQQRGAKAEVASLQEYLNGDLQHKAIEWSSAFEEAFREFQGYMVSGRLGDLDPDTRESVQAHLTYLMSEAVLFDNLSSLRRNFNQVSSAQRVEAQDIAAAQLLELRTHLESILHQSVQLLARLEGAAPTAALKCFARSLHKGQECLQRTFEETRVVAEEARHLKGVDLSPVEKADFLIKLCRGVGEACRAFEEGRGVLQSKAHAEMAHQSPGLCFAATHLDRLLHFAVGGAKARLDSILGAQRVQETDKQSTKEEVHPVQREPVTQKKRTQASKGRRRKAKGKGRKGARRTGKGKRAGRKRQGQRRKLARATKAKGKERAADQESPRISDPDVTYRLEPQEEQRQLAALLTSKGEEKLDAKEAARVDFLSSLSTRGWKKRPHPKAYRLHTKRLKTLRAAVRDHAELVAHATLQEKRALLPLQISRCQELLESTLVHALASLDLSIGESSHPLECSFGSGRPLKEEHSLSLLAAPLLHASGEDQRLSKTQASIRRHAPLLQELDLAHTAVFYFQRSRTSHPRRGNRAAQRLFALLSQIRGAEMRHQMAVCETRVEGYLEETLQCCGEILSALSRKGAGTLEISQEVAAFLSAPAEGETLEGRELGEQEVGEPPISFQNVLPDLSDAGAGRRRIRHCREILLAMKFMPAAGLIQRKVRTERRQETLAHLSFYLDCLDRALSKREELHQHPLTLLLPALDALHRAMKETIVAGLYNEPIYIEGVHRLALPTHARTKRTLRVENDVCASFHVLVEALSARRGKGALSGLPVALAQRMPWLKGIHDRLCYPHRQRKEDELGVYALTRRLYRNGRKLRKLQDHQKRERLSPEWQTCGKRGLLDAQTIKQELVEDTGRLLDEAILPGLNDLYLLLRGAFF